MSAPLPLTSPRRGSAAAEGCSPDHGTPADAITLTYDCLAPVSQLLTVLSPNSGSSEYWYDLANNRTQRVQGPDGEQVTTAYTYTKADHLLTAGPVTVTVDQNGNLTRRLGGSVDDTFVYDQANRLVRATIVESGTPVVTTYTYDGDGRRVTIASGAATTRYVHDLNRRLPVLLDDGTRSYVWGVPISNQGLVYAVDRTPSLLVYHANGRGSIVSLTDGSGTVTQTYLTDEFGVPTVIDGTVGFSQPFLFTGEPYDDETNLLYLRARYYHPELGRFISRDDFAGRSRDPLSLNRFIYTGNNPTSWADPSGKVSIALCGIIAAARRDTSARPRFAQRWSLMRPPPWSGFASSSYRSCRSASLEAWAAAAGRASSVPWVSPSRPATRRTSRI